MSSKKNKRKKKATASLSKFLKSRKSLGVVLGICLAVFASAYVASAKFSADSKNDSSYSFTINQTGVTKWLSFRIVDRKTKSNVNLKISGYIRGKECHATTSSSAGGCVAYDQIIPIDQDGAGFYKAKFTIVETVEVKKGKTYKKYYLSPDGGRTIVKGINILDPKHKSIRSISSRFPLGTTLEKANKFNFGGKAITIGVNAKKY